MYCRKGQVISAELVLSVAVFLVALSIAFRAHELAESPQNPVPAFEDFAFAFSENLLFSAQSGWSYSNCSSLPITLSASGGAGVNSSRAAELVALLYDDESSALSTLRAGAYAVGFSLLGSDGSPLNVSCAGCSCGGRCFVVLDYSPSLSRKGRVAVANRAVRVVDADGNGAGMAVARVALYSQG